MRIKERVIQSYLAHVRGESKNLEKFLWNAALLPISWISYACAEIIDFLFNHGLKHSEEPVLPVISVGNLTYGGTNKTPFVEMLAKFMLEHGVKPGIVSRGYSRKNQDKKAIVFYNGAESRCAAGDEPLLLSKRLPEVPVAVSKRRIDGIAALNSHGAEVVIADDAFQHRALCRDADILLIDASCPFGSGRIMPAGILREPVRAISRAHLIILTKSDQVEKSRLNEIREQVEKFIEPVSSSLNIFTSRLEIHEWAVYQDGELKNYNKDLKNLKVLAFSAIGNPDSFIHSLKSAGLDVVYEKRFKDHHIYCERDLKELCALAKAHNADVLTCTEKDLYNLPDLSPSGVKDENKLSPSGVEARERGTLCRNETHCVESIPSGWRALNNSRNYFNLPLIIPRVETVLDEPERFFSALTEILRPKLVVASNGYGEDAIGVLLALKLKEKFPRSEILTFPLVGRGEAYLNAGFKVCSAPSVTPSGGVVKYRLRDLLGDMRAGLLRHVKAQLDDWKKLAGRVRTPICVGDVYLLLHTLWGSGARPFFAATAKTVYLNGHWRLERALIKKFALRTWTRDPESAAQLNINNSKKNAVYSGSPIMDLLLIDESYKFNNIKIPPKSGDDVLIMLLPGSRNRAYADLKLLLDTAVKLKCNKNFNFEFRLVLAPTLDSEKFKNACIENGWSFNKDFIEYKKTACTALSTINMKIAVTNEPVAAAAHGVNLLIGLGGTANQVCAGLGIPVISIDEKGKRVQKKLLGDAEILVANNADALADCALKILGDEELYNFMSKSGRERMGSPGAIAGIIEYAAVNNGWTAREELYKKLEDYKYKAKVFTK